jgi:murein DD-endopeptidase MepM/ murein hydrolase activator NlpD
VSRLPFLLGGGVLAAYLLSREREASGAALTAPTQPTKPASERVPGPFVWPIAAWNGRAPVISDGFTSRRPGGRHNGVDLMFKRRPTDPFGVGTPNGSKGYVMPDNVAALAAADGVVRSAKNTSRGFAIVIDHGGRISTFYTHLERLLVPATNPRSHGKPRVKAGQPIGIIGFSPADAAKLKHLHFEIWQSAADSKVTKLDPAALMKVWPLVGGAAAQTSVRNAGLVYRPVGASREPYRQWVRDLKGESGVYIIRERDSREIVYVGSSVNRLYDTLTRHFQTWRRWKGFWKGQYGEGHDPGLTYDRHSVDVAVRITRASDALDEESRLIQRLRPRDNLIGQPVDDVPF